MPEIPLVSILPSPTNPRKHFDKDKLAELAANIKKVGILQPILVRKHPGFALVPGREDGKQGWLWESAKLQVLSCFNADKAVAEANPPYELVAGERRFRAAKLAGLTAISVTIKELTDIEVAEIQAIENDQREDVLPSERAAGYQNLIRLGQSVEQIATKVGKSTAWLRGVLQLNKLDEECLDAIDAGKIPQETAKLIARVPTEQARKTVTLCVLQACRWPEGLNARGKVAEEPLSSRETKNLIQQHFCRELKGAPFNRKDTKLPGGSCEACPKRAGNAGDEYADVREDTCLDPTCFRDKAEVTAKKAEATAAEKGFTILSEKEREECFRYSSFMSSTYIQLDKLPPWELVRDLDRNGELDKPLRKWLGDKLKTMKLFLVHGPDFHRYELVKKADAKKALPAPEKTPTNKSGIIIHREDTELQDAVQLAIMEQVATKAASEMHWLTQQNYPKLLMKLMRTLIFSEAGSVLPERVCQRRGVAVVKGDDEKALKSIVDANDFTFGEMFGLLCELRASDHFPDDNTDIVKALGIDRKQIEKEVKAKLKEAKKAPKKKAGAGV